MEREGDSPSTPDPDTDALDRAGRRALDLLHRDLDGELEEVVAGRYRLADRLGHGAQGTVFRALDELTGATVAVKLLPPQFELQLVQLRSEIAALRLLRLPGVVHLFDEGVHHGRPFLVMELVEGAPFPGELPAGAARWTWELVRDRALALLDVLGHVHAAGLVHRDLKPRNVLVTAGGRPVVLDFGLTVGRALADDSASSSQSLGTPAYAAPEQVRGEPVDARADLYAFGIMLWEALAGRRPHASERVSGLLRARLDGPAEPLAQVAPDVPPDVAAIVDELLERPRDKRPRSALDVAERLRGRTTHGAPVRLAFVGRETALDQILLAAQSGRSVRLTAPAGCGVTRLLEELAARLTALGRRVLWLPSGSNPFDSLEPLAGWLDPGDPCDLKAAREASARALRRALGEGVIMVVDGLEDLDEWSRAVVLQEGGAGGVLVARGEGSPGWAGVEEVSLQPLTEQELRGLFDAQDRLWHVREDAARELWERTAGLAGPVEAELEGWRRAGLVEPAGSRWHISRAAVDRLRGGLNVLPAPISHRAESSPLAEALDELLSWIHLCWPSTSQSLLVEVSGRAPWLVDAELERLIAGSAVRPLMDGRFRPLRAARRLADSEWLASARQRAHGLLGQRLPPGSTGRLYHLVAGGAHESTAREALVVAHGHWLGGRLGDAEVALAEGLNAARRCAEQPGRELEQAILREWLPVALAEITPVAADRLLYQLGRSPWRGRGLQPIERLVRGAIAAYEVEGPRAMQALSALPEFHEAELDRWRHALRVRAARLCPIEVEEQVVEEACAWARTVDRTDTAASAREWEGRLRYREGRFAEAAALLDSAADLAPAVTQQIMAMLNAASALLEIPALDECMAVARRAGQRAADCRLPWYEGRAQWLVRAASYRRGDDLQADPGLVTALEQVGNQVQAAVAAVTEAAFAWRRGQLEEAAELAATAVRLTTGSGYRDAFLLARALQCAATGKPPPPAEAVRLMSEACTRLFAPVGAQVVALLARSGAAVPLEARRLLAAARLELEGQDLTRRLDVLALSECSL